MSKRESKTIGEMTNTLGTWAFNASTRVVKNKKGKGSYNSKKFKRGESY